MKFFFEKKLLKLTKIFKYTKKNILNLSKKQKKHTFKKNGKKKGKVMYRLWKTQS
jgi:hypothetical protein